MVSLTLLLVAAEHASMVVAGLVVAGYTLGQAVTGPVRGPAGRPVRAGRRAARQPILGGAGARAVLALALALGAAVSAAVGGARMLAGHAPGPFGRNESSGGGQP